ncbi:unnamed protein product [Pedinophyceae sp. YPF-701]|nr:unnamed protein product [Pedinophyceae sp. YPF-701]
MRGLTLKAVAARSARPAAPAAASLPRVGAAPALRGPAPVRAERRSPGTPYDQDYSPGYTPQPPVFENLERIIQTNFPGGNRGWEEVEGGALILRPASKTPRGVVHFIGGAFVGAAPQFTYSTFLEALASKGLIIVATPYNTGFDHMRICDECNFKFDRAMIRMGSEVSGLPVYGVGHSLGSLIHMLICSRYPALSRAGNVLMSFNNRPATDSIPFLAPVIAPSASLVGPILKQLMDSPVRAPAQSAYKNLRNMAPGAAKQLLPLFEQLQSMYIDVSQGRREFIPAPEETRRLLRSSYGIPKNLLVRFKNDSIDETADLSSLLSNSSGISEVLNMTVKVLPGGHERPLAQSFVEVPPQVARAGSSAAEFMSKLGQMASEAGVPSGPGSALDTFSGAMDYVSDSLAYTASGSKSSRAILARDLEDLAEQIAFWMGVSDFISTRPPRQIPAPRPEAPRTSRSPRSLPPAAY